MERFDLEDSFYAGKLPDEFLKVREKVNEQKLHFADHVLVKKLDLARRVLEFSNRDNNHNEIISIYADRFAKYIEPWKLPENSMNLGVDVYQDGFGSLIREGVFNRPDLFSRFVGELNENGIFQDDKNFLEGYCYFYRATQEKHDIENFPFDELPVDIIHVYRMIL